MASWSFENPISLNDSILSIANFNWNRLTHACNIIWYGVRILSQCLDIHNWTIKFGGNDWLRKKKIFGCILYPAWNLHVHFHKSSYWTSKSTLHLKQPRLFRLLTKQINACLPLLQINPTGSCHLQNSVMQFKYNVLTSQLFIRDNRVFAWTNHSVVSLKIQLPFPVSVHLLWLNEI